MKNWPHNIIRHRIYELEYLVTENVINDAVLKDEEGNEVPLGDVSIENVLAQYPKFIVPPSSVGTPQAMLVLLGIGHTKAIIQGLY